MVVEVEVVELEEEEELVCVDEVHQGSVARVCWVLDQGTVGVVVPDQATAVVVVPELQLVLPAQALRISSWISVLWCSHTRFRVCTRN